MPEEKDKEAQPPANDTAAQTAGKKKKKINEMTLEELDKKLEEVKEKMGNLTSSYALQLLKRKKELTSASQ